MIPDAATKLAGVVGSPVGHSLSPAIHNAALRNDGMNAVYLAFEVPPPSFAVFVDGMLAAGARGLSVTIPHKEAAYARADELSETAKETGAVNTLVLEDGRVVGHNTDVPAVRRALLELGVDLTGARVLVVGAGGAGRAAVRAVAGAEEILVCNRTAARAEELAGRAGARAVLWQNLAGAAAEVDAIIQTTSVGLDASSTVLDAETLEAAAAGRRPVVLDLVYGPGGTPFVGLAKAAGLRAADGMGVLVNQGAAAYELWWGRVPDVGVMREAAEDAAAAG